MNKKTKWTRVAVSGPTIDGREITPQQINEMAASYNPAVYQANIWMEHIRSSYPDSTFGNYGHVLALKAEDYAINGTTQRALYAEMEVTPALVEWNAKNQKKGFSIEIAPNFAKTNQAYLSGLAVTDSPASLGTEALQFNIQVRHKPEHIFSTALEFTGIDFVDDGDVDANEKGLFKSLFAGLFAAQREQNEPPKPAPKLAESNFSLESLERVLTQFASKQDDVITELKQQNKALSDSLTELKTEFESLKNTPEPCAKQEFVAGNGANEYLADV